MYFVVSVSLAKFTNVQISNLHMSYADVIGHIVEKDSIREREKNGRKSRVIDLTLEDLEYGLIS